MDIGSFAWVSGVWLAVGIAWQCDGVAVLLSVFESFFTAVGGGGIRGRGGDERREAVLQQSLHLNMHDCGENLSSSRNTILSASGICWCE